MLEIRVLLDCDCEEYYLLAHDPVLSDRNLPNFCKEVLRLSGFWMGTLVSSETSVSFSQNTRLCTPDNSVLCTHILV